MVCKYRSEAIKAGLKRIKEKGHKLGRPFSIDRSFLKEIVAMKKQGMSYRKISEELGISASQACLLYRKYKAGELKLSER